MGFFDSVKNFLVDKEKPAEWYYDELVKICKKEYGSKPAVIHWYLGGYSYKQALDKTIVDAELDFIITLLSDRTSMGALTSNGVNIDRYDAINHTPMIGPVSGEELALARKLVKRIKEYLAIQFKHNEELHFGKYEAVDRLFWTSTKIKTMTGAKPCKELLIACYNKYHGIVEDNFQDDPIDSRYHGL